MWQLDGRLGKPSCLVTVRSCAEPTRTEDESMKHLHPRGPTLILTMLSDLFLLLKNE